MAHNSSAFPEWTLPESHGQGNLRQEVNQTPPAPIVKTMQPKFRKSVKLYLSPQITHVEIDTSSIGSVDIKPLSYARPKPSIRELPRQETRPCTDLTVAKPKTSRVHPSNQYTGNPAVVVTAASRLLQKALEIVRLTSGKQDNENTENTIEEMAEAEMPQLSPIPPATESPTFEQETMPVLYPQIFEGTPTASSESGSSGTGCDEILTISSDDPTDTDSDEDWCVSNRRSSAHGQGIKRKNSGKSKAHCSERQHLKRKCTGRVDPSIYENTSGDGDSDST